MSIRSGVISLPTSAAGLYSSTMFLSRHCWGICLLLTVTAIGGCQDVPDLVPGTPLARSDSRSEPNILRAPEPLVGFAATVEAGARAPSATARPEGDGRQSPATPRIGTRQSAASGTVAADARSGPQTTPVGAPTRGGKDTTATADRLAPVLVTRVPRPTATPTPTEPPIGMLAAEFVPTPYLRFGRPFAPENESPASRFYPYGTTADNAYLLHHGIDISNPLGVPVAAVEQGVVEYAGDDLAGGWGPDPDFYGQLVVLRHDGVFPGALFSLYGHLSANLVERGERVTRGQPIGEVGAGGVALGPHLHLEFRTAAADYGATLNPELFLDPPPGQGILVGRLVDANGTFVESTPISIYSLAADGSTDWIGITTTYPGEPVNSDPFWQENFLFADLAEGQYVLGVEGRALRVEEAVEVRDGAVTRITLVR